MWSKMATTEKKLPSPDSTKNYTITQQLYIEEYVVFSWKKGVWDIIITFLVWTLLGGTELFQQTIIYTEDCAIG
jgi:hypothetical protein